MVNNNLLYGLIGRKLGHSFSAEFFNKKFKEEGINASYRLFELKEISELPEILINNKNLKGLNVTVPFKEEVLPYLTSIAEEAEEIGAVNVLKINPDKNKLDIKGFNTDVIGFRDSLVPLLRPDINQALILGTGGASKAVGFVLKKLGIKTLFVSRQTSKGDLTYEMIDKKIMEQNLLIVNTTPLGMFPDINSAPPLPYDFITNEHICYDLVYNPLETVFLKKAALKGAVIKNGLEMLHLQAIASWDIWTE